MDYKFKTEPYAHQLHALGASHNKENYALFMEMGTGKSKVLVDNIAMLYDPSCRYVAIPRGMHLWDVWKRVLNTKKRNLFTIHKEGSTMTGNDRQYRYAV